MVEDPGRTLPNARLLAKVDLRIELPRIRCDLRAGCDVFHDVARFVWEIGCHPVRCDWVRASVEGADAVVGASRVLAVDQTVAVVVTAVETLPWDVSLGAGCFGRLLFATEQERNQG
jgi:hypothetical protein